MELNTIEYILEKIRYFNSKLIVNIKKTKLEDIDSWFYDKVLGEITNKNHSFFQITGIKKSVNQRCFEQPIIIQNEIGYLGIIRKKINNEYHYLMQYKVEPGNINKIQISPTIQATKSNFTQKHGGRKPAYLDYFIDASKYKIIADQIQSEQSSRFLGKRNRNIIIELPENTKIKVLDCHDWMTLKQIKQLMRYDNIVNMDTRTVLSCIPTSVEYHTEHEINQVKNSFSDKSLFNSIYYGDKTNHIPYIYQYINNFKMFSNVTIEKIPLFKLKNWSMENGEFISKIPFNFKVIFCNINIEGREVQSWGQPLFEATGMALFGLFTCIDNGIRKFLIKCRPEIGCFDAIEIGPSVQKEFISNKPEDKVEHLFNEMLNKKQGVLFNTILSEEGGRFYHEQNRNVIIEIEKNKLELPKEYFWCDYKTLNMLIQVNNTLNIQLRNLLSVLEF